MLKYKMMKMSLYYFKSYNTEQHTTLKYLSEYVNKVISIYILSKNVVIIPVLCSKVVLIALYIK
jgi:hypothetical protein